MAEFNDKPSLASFSLAVNNDLKTNPNAQRVAQNATETLSPTGSFTTYNYNREDALRYDDPELGYLPFRNNENLYGEYQSAGEKWANGLTKFAAKTSTAILGNLGGMVYGIGSAIVNGDITNVFDNDVTRKLTEFDDYMDQEYASYYTDAEKQAGLVSRMGTANFWSDKVLGGASFMAGAIISEAIMSAATAATFGGAGLAQVGMTARILDKGRKLFKTASKVDDIADVTSLATRGAIRGADDLTNVVQTAARKAPKLGEYVDDAARVSNQVFDDAVNVVGKANALNRIGTFARQQVFATGYEAGVEAMHHGRTLKDELIRKYEDTYGETVDAEALSQIDALVNKSEISTFASNLALLTVTNAAQFKEFSYGVRDLIPRIGKTAGSKIAKKEILEEVGEEGLKKFIPGFEKWSKLRKASDIGWAIAKNPIMEGPVEEGLQGVINNTFHEYNLHKYNPAGIHTTMDFTTALGDALTKQYGTVDGWEENMIGMILGGAGMPMIRRKTNDDGTKGGFSFDISGGIASELKERKAKREDIQNRANFLQKTYDAFVTKDKDGKSQFDSIAFTNSIVQNSVETASILQQRDGFVNAGDFKRAKDSDADLAFSYFKARYDTGRYESTLQDTVDMIEKMSPQEFGEQFQYDPTMSNTELEKRKQDTIKSFTREAENIKSALRQADTLLPQANENLRAGIAHAIYRGKNAEDRISSISEKISFLTNNAVTKDQLAKALDNQYDFAAGTIADPNVPDFTKKQAVADYKKSKQLIREIDRLEQQYNAPVLGSPTEEQLAKNLELRTKLQNEIIAKKEEYLELGKKYSAQFRVIKDVNDIRLANMIGNMKAYDELNTTIEGYVDSQGENSVEVESLHKDLSKLLADKTNFTRLYNYLFTKKGQEEFESTDKSIKNALTQDYLKLANKYMALNSSLGEEEFARNTAAQMEMQKRIFERIAYEKEQSELTGAPFDEVEAITRISKEEYHRQRKAFLSDRYYDANLDNAEENKTINYAQRLLAKGSSLNLGSFAEGITNKDKKEESKDEVKDAKELNEEIAKSNADIEKVSQKTGKDLNNVKGLNRAIKNAENVLNEYNAAKSKNEDLTTISKTLTDKFNILTQQLDLVEKEFDELLDKNPDLDSEIEKTYNDHIDEAQTLSDKIKKTLTADSSESNPTADEQTNPDQKLTGDIKTIVEYPEYFSKLFRGTQKSPIEGMDFNITKSELVEAWENNNVVVRKRRLDTPIDFNANQYIKRKQEFSYDVIVKNADGTERLVGVMSTPNSFKFVYNGKESKVDFLNNQHIKAFNQEFVNDVNELTEIGQQFQSQGVDISEWETKYLEPLQEGEEVGTEQLKEVMSGITRNTFMSFSHRDEKPVLSATATLRNFDENAITISSINVKPRYSDSDYETLTDIKAMYVLTEEGVILITKDTDGVIKEWNINNAKVIADSIRKEVGEEKFNLLKEHGTDRFLICKPLQDSLMPIGLMGPAFNKPLSITDALDKLSATENLTDVELEQNEQGVEVVTGIDLGDGYTGVIIPISQQRNKDKKLPTPVIINLTSSGKAFQSEATLDPPSEESGSPQQAYIPLIPIGDKTTTIGYKVSSQVQKDYSIDKNGVVKPYYRLNLVISKNTDQGEKEVYLNFFLNKDNKTGKWTYSPNIKGIGKLEISSLDDFLTSLHRPKGNEKTLLQHHIDSDTKLSKDKRILIDSLLKNFSIGYNSKLGKTVLRKSADRVEDHLASGEAGGRVEFIKKNISKPKPVPNEVQENTGSSSRRSKRPRKDNPVSSQQQQSSTTPFQDFINTTFKTYINNVITTFEEANKLYPDANSIKQAMLITDVEKSFDITFLEVALGRGFTNFVNDNNSDFFNALKMNEIMGVNPLYSPIMSILRNYNPELNDVFIKYSHITDVLQDSLKPIPFTDPLTVKVLEKLKGIVNLSDVVSSEDTSNLQKIDAKNLTNEQLYAAMGSADDLNEKPTTFAPPSEPVTQNRPPIQPNQRKTYSGKVTSLQPNQIFVFGSNPLGINGNPSKGTGGAALVAYNIAGVKQGEKMDNKLSDSGKAWGMTTVTAPGKKRSKTPEEITEGIKKLYEYAKQNPTKEFLVSDYSGTNLNGYTGQEMANMFVQAGPIPSNIVFNENFDKLVSSTTTPLVNQQPTINPTTPVSTDARIAAEQRLKEIWNSIGNGPGRNALEEGWAESFGYLAETLSVGGQNYQSHGMGKSSFAYAIRDLFELFNKGIAADRGGGQLYTAPLAISEENKAAASAIGTAGGTAYTDGAFVLVAKQGVVGIRSIDDIGGILVNSGLTDINPEILTELRKAFPGLVIESYKNAKGLVEQLNEKVETVSTGNNIVPIPPTNPIQQSPNKNITFSDNIQIAFDGTNFNITVNGTTYLADKIGAVSRTLSSISDEIGSKFVRTKEEENLYNEIDRVKKVLKKYNNIFAMTDQQLKSLEGSEIKTFCGI